MKLFVRVARKLADHAYGGHSSFVDQETLVDTHWHLWKTESILASKAFCEWLKDMPSTINRDELIQKIKEELKNV